MSEFVITIKSVRNKKFSSTREAFAGKIAVVFTIAVMKLLYGEAREPTPTGCNLSVI